MDGLLWLLEYDRYEKLVIHPGHRPTRDLPLPVLRRGTFVRSLETVVSRLGSSRNVFPVAGFYTFLLRHRPGCRTPPVPPLRPFQRYRSRTAEKSRNKLPTPSGPRPGVKGSGILPPYVPFHTHFDVTLQELVTDSDRLQSHESLSFTPSTPTHFENTDRSPTSGHVGYTSPRQVVTTHFSTHTHSSRPPRQSPRHSPRKQSQTPPLNLPQTLFPTDVRRRVVRRDAP